jgi:predicted dehydrogenase
MMYAPAIHKMKDVCIYAVMDPDKDQIDNFVKDYKAEKTYTRFEDILNDKNIDGYIVCSPVCFHSEQVIALANAGKHVMCEKPMGRTVDECLKMKEASAKSGTILMVGFMKRFVPALKQVKQMIESGELGTILNVQASWTSCEFGRPEMDRDKRIHMGGLFADHGAHTFDILRWWIGEVSSVTANLVFPIIHPHRQVDDMGFAMLQYENGVTAMVHMSLADHGEECDIYRVSGTKGVLEAKYGGYGFNLKYLPFWRYKLTLYRNGREIISINDDGRINSIDDFILDLSYPAESPFYGEICHFTDCIRNNTKPNTDANDGIKSIEIINSVYESARLKKTVQLPLGYQPDLVSSLEQIERKNLECENWAAVNKSPFGSR